MRWCVCVGGVAAHRLLQLRGVLVVCLCQLAESGVDVAQRYELQVAFLRPSHENLFPAVAFADEELRSVPLLQFSAALRQLRLLRASLGIASHSCQARIIRVVVYQLHRIPCAVSMKYLHEERLVDAAGVKHRLLPALLSQSQMSLLLKCQSRPDVSPLRDNLEETLRFTSKQHWR